jgi:hypothetical protein
MGLDMYLYEEKYISRHKSLAESYDTYRTEFEVASQILNLAGLRAEVDGGVTVQATVMYWRKANQIHNWFVTNVDERAQEERTYVSREQLIELRDTCQEVLDKTELEPGKIHAGTSWSGGDRVERFEDGMVIANPEVAESLLPTTSGFFFGSTDYNEWYLKDLQATIEGIDLALANQAVKVIDGKEYHSTEFYYYASW